MVVSSTPVLNSDGQVERINNASLYTQQADKPTQKNTGLATASQEICMSPACYPIKVEIR